MNKQTRNRISVNLSEIDYCIAENVNHFVQYTMSVTNTMLLILMFVFNQYVNWILKMNELLFISE
jgi:hypothetical protein